MSAQREVADRWMADDTEESIVGADWHQEAIVNLWSGLREVATRAWLAVARGQSADAGSVAS